MEDQSLGLSCLRLGGGGLAGGASWGSPKADGGGSPKEVAEELLPNSMAALHPASHPFSHPILKSEECPFCAMAVVMAPWLQPESSWTRVDSQLFSPKSRGRLGPRVGACGSNQQPEREPERERESL